MIRRSHRSCAMLDHLSKPAAIWLRLLSPPVDTTTSPSCSLVLDQAARSDVSLSWGGKKHVWFQGCIKEDIRSDCGISSGGHDVAGLQSNQKTAEIHFAGRDRPARADE